MPGVAAVQRLPFFTACEGQGPATLAHRTGSHCMTNQQAPP
jgi:hypothetical protein